MTDIAKYINNKLVKLKKKNLKFSQMKNKGVDCFETWRIYRITQRGKGKNFWRSYKKSNSGNSCRPSCHGDNLGVYNLYPDGTKNILNYTKKEILNDFLKSQELQP